MDVKVSPDLAGRIGETTGQLASQAAGSSIAEAGVNEGADGAAVDAKPGVGAPARQP